MVGVGSRGGQGMVKGWSWLFRGTFCCLASVNKYFNHMDTVYVYVGGCGKYS